MPDPSYLAQYRGFKPMPNAKVATEFRHLTHYMEWKSEGKAWHKHWTKYLEAEVHHQFGDDLKSLSAWQKVCKEVGLDRSFSSIKKCKIALRSIHVCIIDLLDSHRTGAKLKKFRSAKQLDDYIKKNPQQRVFPREIAKGGFLRGLLHHLE